MSDIPIFVLAGQSNAALAGLDNRIVELAAAGGGAFEFVKVTDGGTSLFPNADNDWSPSSGELFADLVEAVNAAIQNVIDQGHTPVVYTFWVNERDKQEPYASQYADALTDFIEQYRAGIGQADAYFSISLYPYASSLRDSQLEVAASVDNVDAVETAGTSYFDGVHWDKASRELVAESFFEATGATMPAVASYENLLAPASVVEGPLGVTVTGPQFTDYVFTNLLQAVKLTSFSGDDRIVTGAFKDNIVTGGNEDRIRAGGGQDFVSAGAHDDRIYGEAGNDRLLGGEGSDYIEGGSGSDLIEGGERADRLLGGDGNDRIVGGRGQDHSSGGAGADLFIFNSGDSGSTMATADRIADFDADDRIDLRAFDGLRFIGTGSFSGERGEVRYVRLGSDVLVEGDEDGDGAADFLIRLSQVDTLTSADFIL